MIWNRLGTKVLPKLRSGTDLKVALEFSLTVDSARAQNLASELRQILQELGLSDSVRIEQQNPGTGVGDGPWKPG